MLLTRYHLKKFLKIITQNMPAKLKINTLQLSLHNETRYEYEYLIMHLFLYLYSRNKALESNKPNTIFEFKMN